MMRLPAFRYLAPGTAAEAARILADHGPEAMAVAGGTDLYPNMKRRQFAPKVVVGLRGMEGARGIAANGSLRRPVLLLPIRCRRQKAARSCARWKAPAPYPSS